MLTEKCLSLRIAALFLLWIGAPAQAAVELSFYSKELGVTFPHAFVRVSGSVDRTGEPVDANYGFTATTISPAILMGSVKGKIVSSSPAYVDKSDRHFSFVISDDEYDRLLATVERWRRHEQPSYNLNRRNCVFFVADVARTLGMKADTPPSLMKKPTSYVRLLGRDNRSWLEQRGASIAP